MPREYREACAVTPVKKGISIKATNAQRAADVIRCDLKRAGAVRHYDRVTR